jgi:hypothetical protein
VVASNRMETPMYNLFYVIGLVVIVIAVLSLVGLA